MNTAAITVTRQFQYTGHQFNHVVCCDENTAMCGLDVTGEPWENGKPTTCPICKTCEDGGMTCTIAGCRNHWSN